MLIVEAQEAFGIPNYDGISRTERPSTGRSGISATFLLVPALVSTVYLYLQILVTPVYIHVRSPES